MSIIKTDLANSFQIEMGVAGFFKFEALLPDGSVKLLSDWHPNLILNQGLERMGVGQFVAACQVGNGTAEPLATDTALTSFYARQVAATSQTNGAQSTEPYYSWRRWVWTFAPFGTNQNLSEVGVDWAAGANLFSKSLIKDSEGDPVTLTVLAAEQLIVTYELRFYPPLADVTGTIGGRDFTIRAANVTNNSNVFAWSAQAVQVGIGTSANAVIAYTGTIGPITGQPSGSGTNAGTRTNSAYGSGNLYREAVCVWPIGGDTLTWPSFRYAFTIGAFQVEFDPPFEKTPTNVMTLTPRIVWARAA